MELGNAIFGNSRGEFPIDRDEFQKSGVEAVFQKLLDQINADWHGCCKNPSATGGFKNDTFEINPYYWGNCTCDADEKDLDQHEETCALMRHNFVYYFDNTWIDWYKYAFRDAYSNKQLTPLQWIEIFNNCIASIN